MSIIQISEYGDSGLDVNGVRMSTVQLPAVAYQEVTISGTSAQSAAFNAATKIIRINADAACRIRAGSNPTALATDTRINADAPEYFGVKPGDKLAIITG